MGRVPPLRMGAPGRVRGRRLRRGRSARSRAGGLRPHAADGARDTFRRRPRGQVPSRADPSRRSPVPRGGLRGRRRGAGGRCRRDGGLRARGHRRRPTRRSSTLPSRDHAAAGARPARARRRERRRDDAREHGDAGGPCPSRYRARDLPAGCRLRRVRRGLARLRRARGGRPHRPTGLGARRDPRSRRARRRRSSDAREAGHPARGRLVRCAGARPRLP